MTYHRKISVNEVFDPNRDLKSVRRHLDLHGKDLASAAHVLGGGSASARVFVLIASLRETRCLTRPHRRQLVALHKLLTLDAVGDPERIETARFANIDPESPLVEHICLLADMLKKLLLEIDEDGTGAEPDAMAVFGTLV